MDLLCVCCVCVVCAVFLHDKHSSQKWNDDDVEIGRCISRKLDFQCSTSAEVNLSLSVSLLQENIFS